MRPINQGISIALSLGLFLIALLPMAGADRLTGWMFATRSEVIGQGGMVASSQPLAVQIGIDILKKGGTAVDAAIAVNAALGLMEPTSCGIGGDLFAIVWNQEEKKLYGLNASGPAPRSLSLAVFKQQGLEQIPYYGPLPWTVPGCVDGWFKLHEKFGKLSMAEILAPAIAYARKGFPLSELIAHYWEISVRRFKDYPNFQNLYAPGGKIPGKGDIFQNPQLADTYELLAREGRDAFYRGDLARVMVDYSRRVGGFFQLADFADFQARWVQPQSVEYRGYRVWELPPNGQGIAVLQMLNMLRHFDLKSMGHNSAEYLHTLLEIKKLVYEDRARFYADPDYADLPLRELLSDAYARNRLKRFSKDRANRQIQPDDPRIEKGDTAYLAVADQFGNMVSLIQSNYAGFGSGLCPDGLGFCIQDRGALFSLQEGHPNMIAPGKRPFHTIIPGFVTRQGEAVFSFGVMGGAMQPQGHVQVLLNILEFGMNIQEAGDAPRFRHSGSSQPNGGNMTDGGVVHLESGILPRTIRALLSRGHRIGKTNGGYGGYQGIWRDPLRQIYLGGSESRKDGCAIGY